MIYLAENYGIRTARSAGQYQESFWLGFFTEGKEFKGSDDVVSMADLTMNEVVLCISGKMAHKDADNNDKTNLLLWSEMCECIDMADMDIIGNKEQMSSEQEDNYAGEGECKPCDVYSLFPELEIPVIKPN
ncbi:MAG: hypothetical protein AMJ79_07930 [Phycisphaerae bacterium SM23_30]|nr:MAG: hypothetical protein AMJ79_07930 [Phycisphaerae bacterium SM23_30]